MLKKSLNTRIIEVLQKNRKWHSGQHLETFIQGYKGSSISRVARILASEGLIERQLKYVYWVKRNCIEYRYPTKKKAAGGSIVSSDNKLAPIWDKYAE